MLKKLEEIINQLTNDIGIPPELLIATLESFLKSLQEVPKLPEHPQTIIEQLTDDPELNRQAIKNYYSSLIETLHKFVNMLTYYWKKTHSTIQAPETAISIRKTILEELHNFLIYFEKEHIHLLLHIAKLKDLSGEFELADEYIFRAIWHDIKDNALNEKALKDLADLLVSSSGEHKSRILLLKERGTKLLKESTLAIQKIEELEKIITQKEFIKRSTEEIKQTIEAIQQIIRKEPLDLESLSLKVDVLCANMDVIGKLKEETKENIPIPLREINDNCLKPILKVAGRLSNDNLERECIKILLEINYRLLNYFSSNGQKKLMNLFDRIEYLRLHNSLWDDYRFKECIKEAHELGEKIYTDISSYRASSDQRKLESFLGKFGEICRDMVEFKVCEPTEERDLLLKSNKLLQKAVMRDGKPVMEYFGRDYLRLGRNYMELKQWEDAIRYFVQIMDIDDTKKVDKKIAFNARENIADCYLSLGLESRNYGDIDLASQCIKLAEEFYNKADELPKLSPDDGRHLVGKKADFYFCSQQYGKALPLYEEIMQKELMSPPHEKNLYDCFSYRWGECLYLLGEYDKSIKHFENTLKRNPKKEHRIKLYARMIKLNSITHNWENLNKIKVQALNDTEIQNIELYGVSTEKLDVLLIPDKMEEYISQIDERLAIGDHWAVIDELKEMIRLHGLLEGHDDPVLKTKLAQANIRVGDYGLAIKTLHEVMEFDQRPKNQAQSLAYVGRAYMEQGEYQKATVAFQESFELGGDIGMLLLQAAAYCKLKEYNLSIRKYEQIIQSGKDKKPYITKTGLAKTYWDKYQHECKQEDIINALYHIVDVITEYPEDWQACNVLARMSNNSVAIEHLVYFIEKGHILVAKNLLKEMTLHNIFPNEVILACLRGISSRDTTTLGYWEFVLSSADFLMEATIYSYFFEKEDSFNKLIEDIVSCILNLGNSNHILREYLCASKGSYADFLEEVYARQIAKILEPLSNTQTDLDGVLNTEILPRINQFIQSEIPEGLGVFLNNYKGREPEGVGIRNELLNQFCGNTDLEKEGKYIRNLTHEITPDINVPYTAWFLFENLVEWFYPYPDGLWQEMLSLANKWTIEISPMVNDKHVKVCFSARAFTNKLSEEFKQSFADIQSKHNSCPLPKTPWFNYAFSAVLIEDPEVGCKLSLTIEMPRALPLPDYLQNLNAFLKHMILSFNEGLSGSFEPEKYRKKAQELFPDDTNTLNKEMWGNFIRAYIDWHFSLLFKLAVKGDNYRKAIHDCVKGPLQKADLNTEEQIIEFLSGLERLPMELGRFRRRTLESITGKNSLRKLNLEGIIKYLIDDLSADNNEIAFNIKTSPCNLIYGVEPLLKRAVLNILNNAVWAVRALSVVNKKINIFIFEKNTNVILAIENPFGETITSAPFSSKIGLKSAEYIIKEQGGTITTNRDAVRGIFITKVSLPIDFQYGKGER